MRGAHRGVGIMSAPTFALTFAPARHDNGCRWVDRPQVVTVGRYADVARAWRDQLGPYLSMHSGDPRTHRLYGKAAESALFGLHVIGRGTLSIARTAGAEYDAEHRRAMAEGYDPDEARWVAYHRTTPDPEGVTS